MQKDSEYSVAKGPYKGYPGDWKVIELGNLLNKIRRPVEVIHDHEYQEIGIRSHGKGLFHKEPVKGSDLGNKSVFWVEVDCLIINIVFAWEQAVGITTEQEKGMIASHRFPMWRSKGNIDIIYLLKIFLTPFGRHLLELASPGGAGRNRTLGQDDFNKTPVCIPSNIKEQQKIVEIISTWDRAIELKEQLINEKKQQKKWLMQNLLSGKKRIPGFNSKWQEVKIRKILKIKHGKDQKDVECLSGNIPILASGGQIGWAKEPIYSKPSVLIGRKGTINKPVFIDIPFWTIDTLFYSEISNNAFAKWVYYYFCLINWHKYDESTGVPSLSLSTIESISMNLPPLQEQAAIAKILSTADREIDLHEKQLDELIKQKKVLTQLLLTGAVRVNTQEVS